MISILLQVNEEVLTGGGLEAITKVISKFGARLFIDFISVFTLIRLVYYPVYKKGELFFYFLYF